MNQPETRFALDQSMQSGHTSSTLSPAGPAGLMMPEGSGFDVVEALRSNAATRDTPIMILTSAMLSDADKRVLNGRVSTILQRSAIDGDNLVDLLKRVVA